MRRSRRATAGKLLARCPGSVGCCVCRRRRPQQNDQGRRICRRRCRARRHAGPWRGHRTGGCVPGARPSGSVLALRPESRTGESYHLMVAGTSGAPADSRRPEVHGRPARPHVRRRTRARRQRRRTVLEPTTDGKVADEVTSKSATAHSQCSSRLVAFGVTSRSASAYRGSWRFRSW